MASIHSHKHRWLTSLLISLLLIFFAGCVDTLSREKPESSQTARRLFADPPAEYSTVPFWVWNDRMTDEQIVTTLQDYANQGIKEVIAHPRPGLMTPYLSEEWFDRWKTALSEAEKLDMNIWIYDENSYPSGFAGGLVPEAMPESKGRVIVTRDHNAAPAITPDTVAVFGMDGNSYNNVTERLRAGDAMPEGNYLEIVLRNTPTTPWFAGGTYVDLLKPGVTETFLDITLGAYQQQVGDQFGKRIPGVFTDEPRLAQGGGRHWTDDLEEQFQTRWGYSLTAHLPSLFRPVGDFRRVRHNYYQTLLELFIARWARPYYDYCAAHNLEFTGHYWEHEWPSAAPGSDNMAMYAWQQRPGIDILMNRYTEEVHGHFGNVRSVKELSSAANQRGRRRRLCEGYGAGGWDLRFEDMKRIGDWLYVLGVNTLNQHLSYVSLHGMRKRDHPQSFSYHDPWWRAYHTQQAYFSRLSAALSHGQQINEIVVIEPTSTAWMYQGEKKLGRIGDAFQKMIVDLSQAHIEYDIGCEDIIAHHGRVDGSRLVIGERAYRTVVLAPLTENLNAPTAALLKTYLENGGTVVCCGQAPSRVDGRPSPAGERLAAFANWRAISAYDLTDSLQADRVSGFRIHRADGDKGLLYHQRRHFADGQLVFLVNTSIDAPTSGGIESACGGVEQWNPETGTISPYAFMQVDAGIQTSFTLEPCESLLLFLTNKAQTPRPAVTKNTRTIQANEPMTAQRIGPNVLTIDYVDVSAGGERMKDVYFYPANQFVFRQNGLAGNPWDKAVQFKDEWIRKTFDRDSGFEATYQFTIAETLPPQLWIVIERADSYDITCNGKPITARQGQWWLDRAFSKIDITDAVQLGDNTVCIKASPMTVYHELEPAYLIGEFALAAAASGFTVTGAGPQMQTGSWKQQGCPFYAEGVSYTQTFEIGRPTGDYIVALEKWYACVAEVKVNGQSAGYIGYRP